MLIKALVFFDLAILALSYLGTAIRIWHLTEFDSLTAFISMRVKVSNIVLFFGLLYSWHVIFSASGLYRSRRLADPKQEAADVFKATAVASIVLGLAAAAFRVRMITPVFVAVFCGMASGIVVLSRLLMRAALAWLRNRGHNLRNVLIVGTNPRAEEFARVIDGRPELGYQLIGFVDEQWKGNQEFERNGKSIVADLRHFPEFLRNRVVDEVVIALPMKSFYSEAARIVGQCQEQGVIVRVLNTIFDLEHGRTDSAELDITHVATYSTGLFEGWPLMFKRVLDIFVPSVLLLLLAPLLVIVAILIRWDSPGPIFFVQERVGLNKRIFRIYKFRTMAANAEKTQAELEKLNEADGPVFKIKSDPRITRLGKYLRQTSIDELPQLLNVLKGDMSLVGPRPLPIRDYKGFDQDWLRRRFSVRPGITCLWQVNGRSSLSFHEWMKLDLHYIDNWSLWLDFTVIVRTIPAVIKGVGAA